MDGFAIKSSDTKHATKKNPVLLKIKGKIFAGDKKKNSIKSGASLANTLVEVFCRETISILGLKFTDGRNFFNAISTDVSFL